MLEWPAEFTFRPSFDGSDSFVSSRNHFQWQAYGFGGPICLKVHPCVLFIPLRKIHENLRGNLTQLGLAVLRTALSARQATFPGRSATQLPPTRSGQRAASLWQGRGHFFASLKLARRFFSSEVKCCDPLQKFVCTFEPAL